MRPLFKTIKSFMITNLKSKKQIPAPLGRWSTYDGKEHIRTLQACIDSCGDTLCGNPEIYKKERNFIVK